MRSTGICCNTYSGASHLSGAWALQIYKYFGALILTAGCGKQWLRLDQLTERVLTSCGGKCAPGTPERACLGALRANVAANLDAVPPSCTKWDTP